MAQNIFFQYLSWQFFDMPKNLLVAWGNFLKFNLNYFSIPLLLKTLFSPWRKYKWSYGKGFDIGRFLEVLFSNLISRILGAIMRIFLIVFGIIAEVFIIFIGLFLFLAWLALPFISIIGLVAAINYIF